MGATTCNAAVIAARRAARECRFVAAYMELGRSCARLAPDTVKLQSDGVWPWWSATFQGHVVWSLCEAGAVEHMFNTPGVAPL